MCKPLVKPKESAAGLKQQHYVVLNSGSDFFQVRFQVTGSKFKYKLEPSGQC